MQPLAATDHSGCDLGPLTPRNEAARLLLARKLERLAIVREQLHSFRSDRAADASSSRREAARTATMQVPRHGRDATSAFRARQGRRRRARDARGTSRAGLSCRTLASPHDWPSAAASRLFHRASVSREAGDPGGVPGVYRHPALVVAAVPGLVTPMLVASLISCRHRSAPATRSSDRGHVRPGAAPLRGQSRARLSPARRRASPRGPAWPRGNAANALSSG
jgi:hypothetical protein